MNDTSTSTAKDRVILIGAMLALCGILACLWLDPADGPWHKFARCGSCALLTIVGGFCAGLTILFNIGGLIQDVCRKRVRQTDQNSWPAFCETVKILYETGNYADAAAAGLNVLNETEETWAAADSSSAMIDAGWYNGLGVMYHDYGQFGIAERFYKRALAIQERYGQAPNDGLSTVVENLRTLYQELDRPDLCEPYAMRALTLRELATGRDKPTLIPHLCCLGNLYMRLDRHKEAAPLYERVLAFERTTYGSDHPRAMATVGVLAGIYWHCGDIAKAEQMYKRRLALLDRMLGADHPAPAPRPVLQRPQKLQWSEVHSTIKGLFLVEKYADAAMAGIKVLDFVENVPQDSAGLGTRAALRRDDAEWVNVLGVLFHNYGQFSIAERLYKHAQAIYERDAQQPDTLLATTLGNLRGVYWELERDDLNEEYACRALAAYEQAPGVDKLTLAQQLRCIANIHQSHNRHREAASLYERVLAIEQTMYGFDHPRLVESVGALAQAYRHCEELDKAEQMYKRRLAILDRMMGADHPTLAPTLRHFAEVLHRVCKHTEADELECRATAIMLRKEKPGEDDGLLRSE